MWVFQYLSCPGISPGIFRSAPVWLQVWIKNRESENGLQVTRMGHSKSLGTTHELVWSEASIDTHRVLDTSPKKGSRISKKNVFRFCWFLMCISSLSRPAISRSAAGQPAGQDPRSGRPAGRPRTTAQPAGGPGDQGPRRPAGRPSGRPAGYYYYYYHHYYYYYYYYR